MLSLYGFISGKRKSESTRRGYTLSLCLFLEMIYRMDAPVSRGPDYVQEMDIISTRYLSEGRDHFSDLMQFTNAISHFAPNTASGHFNRVHYWLELNDVSIKREKMNYLRDNLETTRPVVEDHPLSKDEIRKWYEHLSLMARAMLLVQLSSGMRIGEVISLMPEDINFEKTPVEVQVKRTRQSSGKLKTPKGDKTRITFISQEAAYSVQEWLSIRDTWYENAMKKPCFGKKKTGDPRLFPIAHSTVQDVYNRGLQKAGLFMIDNNTLQNRSKISSHGLRRFFLSQMKVAGMPVEMAEAVSGHSGYLSVSYRRFPDGQVEQAYLDAEYAVTLASNVDPVDIKDMRTALGEEISRNIELQTRLDRMDEYIADRVLQYQEYETMMKKFMWDHKPDNDIQKRADIR